MIKLLCLTLSVCGVSILSVAQNSSSNADLSSMVETERAFSSMSKEKGTQPAFLAFIADDGILFRPKAVKGKQWMIDHPARVNDKILLSWGPSYADIASSGDMGYTFGPWKITSNLKDEKVVGWGHFITIWKKQPDGTWKFAVDLGISNPEPTTTSYELEKPKGDRQSKKPADVKVDAERAALVSLEQSFSEDSGANGARKAFASRAASYVNVFRENRFPFTGVAAASEAIPLGAGLWTWKPEGWDVSRSGDLGYSYGTYWLKSSDSKVPSETGNYFRIWKKQGNVWKVVVDVANPVPEKKS